MALEKIKPFIVDGTQDFVFSNATITGNITSNNANLGNLAVANFFSGTLTTGSQPNITSVGTLGNLSVTSNISAGNIKTNNLLYANGSPWQIGTTTTVSGSNTQVQFNDASSFGASANFTFDKTSNTLTVTNLVTNGSGITNITGSSVTGQVPNALIAATVYTNAQPNITSVGTLSSLTVTGNIASGNANLGNTATANYFVGSGNNLSNIQGSSITGAVPYATTANSVAGSNVSGAVTYAATANAVAGANVLGQVGNSIIAGTVYTNSQPNITSVGTLANLTSNGNVNFTNASNVALGAVGNVRITGGSSGQYLSTDGSGVLSWASITGTTASNIANGNSNVNIPSSNGNVNISAVGNANVVVVTGTGANITGYANISGNVTAGNISTSGSGGNITGANVISANTFTATGNITANYFIGNGSLLTGIATNPSNIANGNSNVTVTANGNVTTSVSGNANVLVVTGTGANITGYANVTGNVTAGNISTSGSGGNITGANVISANTFTASANITATNANLGNAVVSNYFIGSLYGTANLATYATTANSVAVANVTGIGNIATTNYNGNGSQVLAGNGAWIAQSTGSSTISNGNSNVNIPSANGNVNISSAGNANIVVVTGTGANITGYANITGNVVANNFIAGSGSGGNLSGANVISANTFIASGNITAGNANLGNAVTANYFVGNGSLLTGISTSASTISNGNSNVNIPSANGNVNISSAGNANIVVVTGTGANITGYANVTGNVIANNFIAGTGSGGNLSGANVISANTFTASSNITAGNANLGNAVTANYFVGNGSLLTGITTSGLSNGNSNVNIPSANGNINLTSVGNTTLVITGTGVNVAGTLNTGSGVITGNGSGLSAIAGANVTGQVGNALIAGTVYTNAQPNITSVGTLSSLSVTGDISGANLVLSGNLTVSGTTTTVNSTVTRVVDPIFELGGGANGASLSSNDNKDRGTLLHYYTGSTATDAFMGWDNSNAEFAFGSNVSVASEVVTFNNLANVRANYFIGNGSQLTGITVSAGNTIVNGNSNVIVNANSNVNISAVGNANVVVVTGTGVNVNGTLNATGNLTSINANLGNAAVANFFVGSGAFLTSVTAVTAATVTTNSQPNITSVGTLTTLIVGNATANSTFGNGTITATGNISFTGANVSLGAVGNLKITGGTAGYFLSTDGAGNLSWGAAEGGGGVSATGSNTQIQFNDGGGLGASANLTFDKATNVFTTSRVVASNGANLGSNVANVYIGGGSNNQILKTDGSGNLSWIAQPATTITVDNFTGDGSTVAFTLTVTPTSINQTIVNYNGTLQLRAAYTVVGSTLTFSEAPVNGSLIEVTTTLGTMSGAGAFVTRSYTGNGVQATFSVTSGCTVSSVIVTENGLVQIPTVDYTISGGTLTFDGAPANGISIQIRELAVAVAATSPGITWNISSSNITMTASNGYFVDTSGGAKTMTLPTTATLGDTIRINDLAGTFGTNNLTVARNGHKIQGDTNDLLIDTDQTSFGLVYSNSTYGWKVLEL